MKNLIFSAWSKITLACDTLVFWLASVLPSVADYQVFDSIVRETATKPEPEHTAQDDFNHFLSYSGHWQDSEETKAALFEAFLAAWEPGRRAKD